MWHLWHALTITFNSPNRKSEPAYLSEGQIVEDMLSGMTDDQRQTWLAVKRDELIAGHHSTGRRIRNHYRLWERLNPYTDDNNVGDNHPDQMSMRIMEGVWDRVHNHTK